MMVALASRILLTTLLRRLIGVLVGILSLLFFGRRELFLLPLCQKAGAREGARPKGSVSHSHRKL